MVFYLVEAMASSFWFQRISNNVFNKQSTPIPIKKVSNHVANKRKAEIGRKGFKHYFEHRTEKREKKSLVRISYFVVKLTKFDLFKQCSCIYTNYFNYKSIKMVEFEY